MINPATHTQEYAAYQANTVTQTLGEVDPATLFKDDQRDTFRKTETYVAQPVGGSPLQEATGLVVKLQPFASGADRHHAVHAKLIGEAAGKLPVLTLASFPRAEVFNREQRARITEGDFQPYADAYSVVIRAALKAYGREGKILRLGLVGTSIGAAVLPQVIPLLKNDVEQVTAVAAQSPGNMDQCHWMTEQRRLAATPSIDYATGIVRSPHLVPHYAEALGVNLTGLDAKEQAKAIKQAQGKLVQRNTLDNKLLALASGRGLSRGGFAESFGTLMDTGDSQTEYALGIGTEDALLTRDAVTKAYEHFRQRTTTIDTVEIKGNHAIWDDPREIANFATYALRHMTQPLLPQRRV